MLRWSNLRHGVKAGDKIKGEIMKLKCNLCGENIPAEHDGKWTLGHNPDPLSASPDDRCCRECNDTHVWDARLYSATYGMNPAEIKNAIDEIRSSHGE